MAKHKKPLTNAYLRYQFSESEYDDDVPVWFDDLDILLGNPEFFVGPNVDVVQPMVYTFYDANRHPLYVGKTYRFDDRVKWHEREGREKGKEPWMQDVVYCGLICCDSLENMDIIEFIETQKKLPRYSSDLVHDTVTFRIALTTNRKLLEIKTFYSEDVFPYRNLFAGGEYRIKDEMLWPPPLLKSS